MRILVHSTTTDGTVRHDLGKPEYSYFFVMREMRPLLETLGQVTEVASPEEADEIHAQCKSRGESCVLLSFSPPHKTPLGMQCPTVPVFAWEYPDLPSATDEADWGADPRNDWAYVLQQVGCAITLSTHTAAAVRRRLGEDYPIAVIPSPVWNRLEAARRKVLTRDPQTARELKVTAEVADSRVLGLDVNGHINPHIDDGTSFAPEDAAILPANPTWSADAWSPPGVAGRTGRTHPVVHQADESEPVSVGWDFPPVLKIRTRLEQVVYSTVLTPADGRKNWTEILTAFVWAMRDAEDAVLLFKMTGGEKVWQYYQLLDLLSRLSPFRCRVLVIHGYLDDDEYEELIGNTDFYVNASLCEGLCIPLMEFLSSGVPAIAPAHSAMADYVTSDIAFVVGSGDGAPMPWPHGNLEQTRTTRNRIDWGSLMRAFRDSYTLAKTDRQGYQAMSARAVEAMRIYCGGGASKQVLYGLLDTATKIQTSPDNAAANAHAAVNDQPASGSRC